MALSYQTQATKRSALFLDAVAFSVDKLISDSAASNGSNTLDSHNNPKFIYNASSIEVEAR